MTLMQWEEARTELWFAWVEIALDHEREAFRARRIAKRAVAAGTDPSKGLELETKAAMTTLLAAAAGAETIGNNLGQFFTSPASTRKAAQRLIAVVNAVFPLAIGAQLANDVRWLFDLRNDTVHYHSDWQPMDVHPTLGLRTTRIATIYSLETAKRSVDVLLAVLLAATTPGRSSIDDAEFWAIRWRSLPGELQASRARR